MMETKPYSLQSPEQIAKDYGGNKRKIAEAMQMGLIDPTAGTLAGMFIDRMRAAQQQEMAPQQTVAQQVFAPPAPPMNAMPPMPAGLGATPQAAAMGAPTGAPPAPPPMEAMPPQGMAMGGLASLPVPDAMFDEPDNGGYASGGLVAFAAGDEVDGGVDGGEMRVIAPEEEEEEPRKVVDIPRLDFAPRGDIGGFKDTLMGNMEEYAQVAPYRTEAAQGFANYLRGQLDPAERERARERDMWTVLGQLGARMASTPGSLLQAIGAGIGEAVPAAATGARERRADERELRQALVGEERTGNQELNERALVGLEMLKSFSSLEEALNNREFENWWRGQDRETQAQIQREANAAGLANTYAQVRAQMRGQDLDYDFRMSELKDRREREDAERLQTGFLDYLEARPQLTRRYNRLRASTNPSEQQLARNIENNIYRTVRAAMRSGNGGFGAPPPGAVTRVN